MIGIVGGGQLAQMLVKAANERNVDVAVQTSTKLDPAVKYAKNFVLSAPNNVDGTRKLANSCNLITFENEWVDIGSLSPLEEAGVTFLPALDSLAPLVDKLSQRRLLDELSIPGPGWVELSNEITSEGKLPNEWKYPIMAKAIRGGYDGKGTKAIKSHKELEAFLSCINPKDWFLEQWVEYEKELSLVASRDFNGTVRSLPIVETRQYKQVCDWVLAPADVSHQVEAMAYNAISSLMTELNYVGVLAIEFFYGLDGLQVNEIAPRTHNSAHFSIDACQSSQFDQQVCIAAGLDVPFPTLISKGALMVNLLGLPKDKSISLETRLEKIRALNGAKLYWYEKEEERPGRKLGHVTFLLDDDNPNRRKAKAFKSLNEIRSIWPIYAES